MSKPTLSIIVVSYNTKDMTLECLESVYRETIETKFELWVYDNDSKDGSADAIAEKYPQVKLIRATNNVGFAMGNNLAIEQVDCEFVLLLNPDTVVLDGAIDKLMAFSKATPYAGIWGGKTLFGDKSLNPNSCFRKMSLWNQFCRAFGLAALFEQSGLFHSEHYGGWRRDTIKKVDIVCGCFLLIKLQLWRDLGGFDKTFFMYAEEADLCLRAKKKGYESMITPDAVIVHYGGGSERVRVDKMVRLISAKVELQKVHWPAWQKPLGRALFRIWVINRIIAYKIATTLGKNQKPDHQVALATWSEIWQRRLEWLYGYSGRKSAE